MLWIFLWTEVVGRTFPLFIPSVCQATNSSCCPDDCGSKTGRGQCVPASVGSSGVSSCDVPQVREWTKVCQCNQKYWGVGCETCLPGWRGTNCTEPDIRWRYPVVEENKPKLNLWIQANWCLKQRVDVDAQPMGWKGKPLSMYDALVIVHLETMKTVNFAHGGPGFTTWHAAFVHLYESLLHICGYPEDLGAPYWPYGDVDPKVSGWLMDSGFFGPNTGTVDTGPFANWTLIGLDMLNGTSPLPSEDDMKRTVNWVQQGMEGAKIPTGARVDEVMKMKPYDVAPFSRETLTGFRAAFEGWFPLPRSMHNEAHVAIGGVMRYIAISANYPPFWLLHTNTQRLWSMKVEQEGVETIRREFPVAGTPAGHGRQDCVGLLAPIMPHDLWIASDTSRHVFYTEVPRQYHPIQQRNDLANEALRILRDPPKPIPPVGTPTVCVVGGGLNGLLAADLLRRSGVNVVGFERDIHPGGRMGATQICGLTNSARRPNPSFAEGGAMRFPCSHKLVFALAKLYNVPYRSFNNSRSDTDLLRLSCFDNKPIPFAALRPDHPEYSRTLGELYKCYNAQGWFERRHPDELFQDVWNPYLERLYRVETLHPGDAEALAEEWRQVLAELNTMSVRDLLTTRYSPSVVSMILDVAGLQGLSHVGANEIFSDGAGQWWNDNLDCTPQTEEEKDFARQFGLPTGGLLEFSEGSQSLPSALYAQVGHLFTFGARVSKVIFKANNSEVLVSYELLGNEHVQRCDQVLFALQPTALATMTFIPPLTERTMSDITAMYMVDATKLVIQLKNITKLLGNCGSVAELYNYKGKKIVDGILGGHDITNTPLGAFYYPSHVEANTSRVTILSYDWGNKAKQLSLISEAELVGIVREAIGTMLGRSAAESIETIIRLAMGSNPEYQGAFILSLPGQLPIRTRLRQPLIPGLAYIASDAVSDWPGWAQGAIVSSILDGVVPIQKSLGNKIPMHRTSSIFPDSDHGSDWMDGPLNTNAVHTDMLCSDGQVTTRIFLAPGTTTQLESQEVERIGQVVSGRVTVTVAGIDSVRSIGDFYIAPPYSSVTLAADPVLGANITESSDARGVLQCKLWENSQNSLTVTAINNVGNPVQWSTHGSLPEILTGKFTKLSSPEQASPQTAAFGLASLTNSEDGAGFFLAGPGATAYVSHSGSDSAKHSNVYYPAATIAFNLGDAAIHVELKTSTSVSWHSLQTEIAERWSSMADLICFAGVAFFNHLDARMSGTETHQFTNRSTAVGGCLLTKGVAFMETGSWSRTTALVYGDNVPLPTSFTEVNAEMDSLQVVEVIAAESAINALSLDIFLIQTVDDDHAAAEGKPGLPAWAWAVGTVGVVMLLAGCGAFVYRRRKQRVNNENTGYRPIQTNPV